MSLSPQAVGTPAVVLDFDSAWRTIVCAKLAAMGYHASPSEPTDKLGIAYFNAVQRRILPRPRTVHLSDVFSCTSEFTAGMAALRLAIEKGDDLTPFLSKRIRDRNYHDPLLNEWGIFHFHLGASSHSLPGSFVERTSHVLLGVPGNDEFYMIDCRLHGKSAIQAPWSQQDLLEIIHRNWPHLIRHARRSDIIDVHSGDVLTDAGVATFRKAGIQGIFKMPDGTIYFPPGGGITTARTSALVVEQLHQTVAQLRTLECWVRDNIRALTQVARGHDIDLGPEIRLHLTCDGHDRVCVVDEATGFRCQLRYDTETPTAECAAASGIPRWDGGHVRNG